jgi:DNA-directed RNA polymerase III subunit RPC4
MDANASPKKVTFTADVKPTDAGSTSTTSSRHVSAAPEASAAPEQENVKIDGIIGQLEIYQSGKVKMRFENGFLLDVSVIPL